MTSLLRLNDPNPYTVETEVYQGPLDLLLQLIERAELDITKLALAQVTDQFIVYMRELKDAVAERVSEFLVVATRLMQIKSEALLPRPVVRQPDEEDPGDALMQQLLLYKRFKEAAKFLLQRYESGLRGHLRLAPPPRVEGRLDLTGLTADDIYHAAMKVFSRQDLRAPLGTVVTPPKVTIRRKIALIVKALREKAKVNFRDLIEGERVRLHIVVTFLAMLELVRRHRVAAKQESLFGEIELERDEKWDEDLDFELEFSE
ncbi:MAG: segregation and condensation protein A [Anaerolineales bacterium]